jgi:TPR repeat protein
MRLREQEISGVPPLGEPTTLRPTIQHYPWKTNAVTTVFWVGAKQNAGKMSRKHESVWDKNWEKDYGGVDNPDPSARRNYIPVAFIPHQNPFYCALPYNDVSDDGKFKPEASLVIPWFKQAYTGEGQSVCWHRWVAIRKGDRTCYAEWEDCGPFRTDHFQYVFGNERPKPNASHGAGLSVSPGVRDYLGLAATDVTDWQFVEVRDVPPGPWRSYGENNHFVIARRKVEEDARELEKSATQGDAHAQSNLGSLYARGAGVPRDYQKAAEWYQKAADQGNPAGQLGLALLYSGGKGVSRDYRKAAELYQKAADQGNAYAQVNLGWLYHEGKGVPQDYRKAVELFQKASDQGYAVGQAYLASSYADGKGVPRDYRKAIELFHKALDQGPSPNVLNDFAWFLATCPDAAQRNGKQAVEYATQACELTEWKSANFIGTLAAAYAEIGDFDIAIKYQKQAMDIPDMDYSDRQQMERSIELYGHRKPYREP